MPHEMLHIDITHMPDLVRVAEEVRASRQARVLRRDNEDVAMIVPTPAERARTRRAGKNAQEAQRAIIASAGGWIGLVDAEQLKQDIKEARGSDREFPSL